MKAPTLPSLLVLATAAALTAGAGSAFGASAGAAPAVQVATDDDSATAYRQRMGAQIDEWKTKVDDYSRQAKAKGSAASEAAAAKLDSAWDDVKTQWGKLQNATDDTWDDTKAAFEKAWRDFQDTWQSTTSRS
jgi:gas vesicle protein